MTTPQVRPVPPALVGCSHGTDDLAGRSAVRSVVESVRQARPHLDVREAFVDVQTPEVGDVVAGALAAAPEAVVVPLLLSVGFHTSVDIAEAVARPGAVAAAPLGPDERLVDVLVDRLEAVGLRREDHVVLAAAGSSVAAAAEAVQVVRAALARRLGRPVAVAYGAGARPRVPDAVEAAREGLVPGGRVVVASYLLAPGYFLDRLLEAGADVVTAPLAPDPRLTAIVLDRYDAARAELATRAVGTDDQGRSVGGPEGGAGAGAEDAPDADPVLVPAGDLAVVAGVRRGVTGVLAPALALAAVALGVAALGGRSGGRPGARPGARPVGGPRP
ncbi:CbiX/SirB N-terminal domain-containing protein [Cellulomonas endophytica]|uniref:CbiX/SirB N-terminal domain-containing protein n=1 Tax=Cellulomonas endophytica TaxID=2494735 RepID=UPI00196B6948